MVVAIQENGIIRVESTGEYIGRIDNTCDFNKLKEIAKDS